jgi:serine/threonine-protein kinase
VWRVAGAVVVVAAVATLIVTKPWITETATDQSEKIMLAVLPFENLGDSEDEYFADGITDEITSRLASVHNLGVISRTSAYAYKESDKTLPQIARELGVDYVLEGTVRWEKSGVTDRVRITPQLIRVSDDMHLWADNYEEALTGIFSVQAAIASNIVKALDLALSDSDLSMLALMPTRIPEAFDCYLRGKRFDASNSDEVNRAESLLHRAIELDPEFALAHARLAYLYAEMYWWSQFYDPSAEWLAKAKRHVDSALTLQPDLADAYAAKGWYYFREKDYRSAQKYLELALDRQPNNAEWHRSVAVIQRRQGKWSEALRSFEQALRLNPRSASLAATYAGTLVSTRNYEKAEKMFDRAVELAPNARWLYIEKSMLYLLWKGDTKQARDVVATALRRSGRWPVLSYVEMQLDLIDGDYEHALALCSEVGSVCTGAISDSAEYYYKRAEVLHLYQPELAVAYCDSARVILEREISNNPDASYSRAFLGQLYAWLGRGDDGVKEGLRAVESYPMAKDAVSAPDLIALLAETYILVGDYESAIDQIDFLLSVPSWVSVPYLRVDPKFDPLRDRPRFQALLEKYEQEHGT